MFNVWGDEELSVYSDQEQITVYKVSYADTEVLVQIKAFSQHYEGLHISDEMQMNIIKDMFNDANDSTLRLGIDYGADGEGMDTSLLTIKFDADCTRETFKLLTNGEYIFEKIADHFCMVDWIDMILMEDPENYTDWLTSDISSWCKYAIEVGYTNEVQEVLNLLGESADEAGQKIARNTLMQLKLDSSLDA